MKLNKKNKWPVLKKKMAPGLTNLFISFKLDFKNPADTQL